MTTPQILAAIIGGAVALASIASFGYQKTRRFKAMFWLAIGGAMVFAAFRPQLIELLGEDTPELRLRLLVALLSFIVLTITLESIRVARMQERYAFLWLATGLLLLVGAVFVKLAEVVTRATGMPYTLIVMVVLFAFIMLMLFSVSLALSRLQSKLAEIARALALTEARVRALETDKARLCLAPDSPVAGVAQGAAIKPITDRPPQHAAHRAGILQAAAVGRFSSEAGTGGTDRLAGERPIREIGPTGRSQSGATAAYAAHRVDKPLPETRKRFSNP